MVPPSAPPSAAGLGHVMTCLPRALGTQLRITSWQRQLLEPVKRQSRAQRAAVAEKHDRAVPAAAPVRREHGGDDAAADRGGVWAVSTAARVEPAQTQQHTTYTASQLATPVKTQQHSTVVSSQPATLTARWDYVARSCAAQDLYFYTLASSPRLLLPSLPATTRTKKSTATTLACLTMGEGWTRSWWNATIGRRSARLCRLVRASHPVRVREEARRARLRYAPAPVPTAASWLPFPSQPHGVLAAQNHFGVDGGRWGVHSARTSPVRGAPPVIKTEWTPPRAAYADVGAVGRARGRRRVLRCRGSRTSSDGRAARVRARSTSLHRSSSRRRRPAPSQQQQQAQARKTHQPRRAVFANAGPPGVSGYAYAY
ncbi:hypothetical protein GGX14DRAFT_597050 [Mycena pura]|uniref:Uncharacterized protein n=1 Tax=Mycena pura TaxID=153505 RepID=A0AAD6XZB8_9AGAR|nr:hypothetical protein GGX14DRAFT_597050 [Mycena pura]